MGPLPAAGQWVQLRVPASQVNLEGRTISGMAFTAYGGRVTWDAAGRLGSNPSLAATLQSGPDDPSLTWPSTVDTAYSVAYKNNLTDQAWTLATQFTATNSISSWRDSSATQINQRFYLVAQAN